MTRASAVACVLLLGHLPLAAQNRVVAEIPIELARNKTVLPVTVGGANLRLILDSGMDYDGILLFDITKVDRSRFEHLVEAQVGGAGSGGGAGAVFDSAASFSIGSLRFDKQRVIILTSDAFRGFPNDGVIGYSLLGHYAVELDYDRNRMVLYDPETFSPGSGWESIDIYFQQNRVPWTDIRVSTTGEAPVRLATYIDFASSEAVELLERDRNAFTMPAALSERHAGRGLSGDIYGKEGRLSKVLIGPFILQDVTTIVVPGNVRSRQEGHADAIIANNLLRRFHVIFDYGHSKLHLKPNRYFAEPF